VREAGPPNEVVNQHDSNVAEGNGPCLTIGKLGFVAILACLTASEAVFKKDSEGRTRWARAVANEITLWQTRSRCTILFGPRLPRPGCRLPLSILLKFPLIIQCVYQLQLLIVSAFDN
jgi:hypothetical protein